MNKFKVLIILFLFGLFCPVNALDDDTMPSGAGTLPYNYLDTTSVPIYLSITEPVSTKDGLTDGMIVKFRVIKDVKYDGRTILKQGDIVKGQVDIFITSGMNGFPAEIIIDRFEIPGVKHSQLISKYVKKGQNRCFAVYPLKWALTFIPFAGSLTNLIKGGHAVIKTTDIITIYYYPNWL